MRYIAVALGLMTLPARLPAQGADTPPVDKKPVPQPAADTGKYALITHNDLLFSGGFVLATVGVSQLDVRVAQKLQRCQANATCVVPPTARAFNFVGVPGTFILAGGSYVVGRAIGNRGLAEAGLHTSEAIVLSEVMTYLIKWSFGRERPYSAGTDDADDFKIGRGLKGEAYSSFPSGHASGAFAAAAAATTEISSRWPKATIFLAPILYGSATMVAWARLQSNKHWLSDVFMGAGMGTLIGIKVVRFNHKHPGNFIDRWLLPRLPAITPNGRGRHNGVTLIWTWQPAFLN